ncbi:hypothetical protein [Flavobacterium beibuense]|uniref:hypothetical protein n=1 Tax=Flavobacterium beibuense TaxID=657326 RepID=UPI003A8DE5C6
MKINQLFFSLTLLICHIGYSQEKKESFLKNSYISDEAIFRSYGTNEHTGFGGGIEISKNFKKWLGFGINISYWEDKKLDWYFRNPFTDERYEYSGKIKEFKISPFVQLIAVNTKYFDFIIQTGLRTGYYHQNYYLGGYHTNYNPDYFDVFIYDDGYKGLTIGYELGASLRFQINNVIVVPSINFSNDSNGNSFSELALKVGLQL